MFELFEFESDLENDAQCDLDSAENHEALMFIFDFTRAACIYSSWIQLYLVEKRYKQQEDKKCVQL